MPGFDDVNNALGYLVVQLAAHSIKTAEIAQNARETYETASVYMQEQLRAIQEQKQTIEKQEKELERVKEALGIALSKEQMARESTGEPRPKMPRLGERERPPSEFGGSQGGGGQGGLGNYLCYRCHRYGKNAKQGEASIESLLTSS